MIVGSHDRRDAATDVKVTAHGHSTRMTGRDKVVQDPVDDRLVIDTLLAIGVEVEFQRLQFQAEPVRYIVDGDGGKVRLPGLGADGGKLRAGVYDTIVALRAGIVKNLQQGDLLGRRYLIQVQGRH